MLTKEELLKYPNYLLKTYQLEIYKQLIEYKEANKLTQKELAQKLGVSNGYVSQVLNGNFNFTLKKLIELGLMMNKIPYLEWLDPDAYWFKEKEAFNSSEKTVITLNVFSENLLLGAKTKYQNAIVIDTENTKEYVQTISSKETLFN